MYTQYGYKDLAKVDIGKTCILLASVVGSPQLLTEFVCAVSYTDVYLAGI